MELGKALCQRGKRFRFGDGLHGLTARQCQFGHAMFHRGTRRALAASGEGFNVEFAATLRDGDFPATTVAAALPNSVRLVRGRSVVEASGSVVS